MLVPEKVAPDPGVSEDQNPVKENKLHGSMVSRLLAQASKSVGVYADYQMETGVWRKLAL